MEKFNPDCTFPNTSNAYVEGPNIRSTTDIAWSCASIIILSTWSVLCLPVPPDVRPDSTIQHLRKELFLLRWKLFWMATMLIFPEYLLSMSITNLFSCRVNNFRLKELAATDNVQWTLKHSMLADMGGIAIRFSEAPRLKCSACGQSLSATTRNSDYLAKKGSEEKKGSVPPHGLGGYIGMLDKQPGNHECPSMQPCEKAVQVDRDPSSPRGDTSRSRSKASRKGELEKECRVLEIFRERQKKHLSGIGSLNWRPWESHVDLATNSPPKTARAWYHNDNASPFHGNIWILDARQLILAREYGIIPSLPSIDDVQIEDKSKSDGLVRVLAILQVSWLAIQLIARRVDGLPPTQLEISTLAFSACAFVLYIVEWSKPKDVGVPFYVDTDVHVTSEAFQAILGAAPVDFLYKRHYYMPMSKVHQLAGGRYKVKHRDTITVMTNILTTLLFGGIHLLAWDLDFPTQVEGLLWKIAALSATLAPTLGGALGLGENLFQGTMGTKILPLFGMALLVPVFVIARLYLIVESVRSIMFLPPAAFVATWASNIPHFT